MKKRVELLAPCGSYESFLAAVNAGADAVYLGGREFGARAYAENFSEEELVSAIRQAHLFNVKVYLTVNTLVKEREFSKIYGYMLPLYEAELDGVIVQDMGVLGFLRERFPDLKFHASTQMTITGIYGADYLKKAGCERIVPARELSLEEITFIKERVPVEIEAFVHGAMCYCYSGQCLMSSMIGGRSGNRGRCAQPCRLPYKTAGKEGCFLSLKDMNTLEYLPELIGAGIDSFKIEGRMKKPEYVAGVVSVYRKYIDRYYEGGPEFRVDPEDKRILNNLYIRSETGSGYYLKSRGREMLTLQKPGYNEADPALLKSLRESLIRELPKKALHILLRCRAGEPLYMEGCLSDIPGKTELCVSVSGPVAERADKRPVSGEEIREQLEKTGGTPFVVEECSIELGENTFVPMKWIKQLRRELLQKIYGAGGARNLQDCRKEEAGPGADTENIRRRTADNSRKQREKQGKAYRNGGESLRETVSLSIIVRTKEQFEAAVFDMEMDAAEIEAETGTEEAVEKDIETDIEKKEKDDNAEEGRIRSIKSIEKTVIADADMLMENAAVRDRLSAGKLRWGIKCPVILQKSDEGFLEKLRAVIEEGKPDMLYCSTIDGLAWIKSISYQGQIAGEASLYAWNQEAVSFWDKELDGISIPLELDSKEIRELCRALGEPAPEEGEEGLCRENKADKANGAGMLRRLGKLEAPAYGRVPFMVSANCIKLSAGRCDKNRGRYAELTDRMGNVFPVYTNCGHCYNIIYNCLPSSYHENLWMLLQDGIRAFRVEFTTEDGNTVREVLKTFQGILASELQEKNKRQKTGRKDQECRAGVRAAGRVKGKNKSAGKGGPETEKGKIAGMETTQGCFRRPVE